MKKPLHIPIHGVLSTIFLLMLWLTSCESFIDIAPSKTELSSATVFESDLTAQAAVASIYVDISASAGIQSSITALAGFAADELVPYTPDADFSQVYENTISSRNAHLTALWATAYGSIYKANAVLEGIARSVNMTAVVKQQLEGEVRFLRAFQYFYLVNLFGDVPLITTTDYNVNRYASRAPAAEVYASIVNDLLLAKELLADDFSFSVDERVKPNRWAAEALLARVYLYTGEWANAETEATQVIDHTAVFSLVSPDEVFLTNSSESIWQVLAVRENINTETGFTFVLVSEPDFASLTDDLVDAFEPEDVRKASWVGTFDNGSSTWSFPFKYKIKNGSDPLLEYEVILRLAEQYLIRAEARTYQDNFGGAAQDINSIRSRAQLPPLDPASAPYNRTSLLLRIEQERRVELFCEWGHRWLDLKRTGRTETVLAATKPGWEETDELFPIPESEILLNVNLQQNLGY